MATTRTDLTHGHSISEIEITILDAVSESTRADAYEVEDATGEQFLLVTSDTNPQPVQKGRRYRIENALGADPSFDEATEFAEEFAAAAEAHCPRCETPLTFASGLESPTDSVQDTLIDVAGNGCHLILTAEAQIFDLSSGDDWRPLNSRSTTSLDREKASRFPPVASYHCPNCPFSVRSSDITESLQQYLKHWEEQSHNAEEQVVEDAEMLPPTDNFESLGMATGGTKDTDNFRDNIYEGHLPSQEAVTYEGLFYDYYFDTSADRETRDSLFYPSYSTAVTDHPITSQREYYVTVGLNSTIGVQDFERRQLNLVAVLDVSGSMSSQFDQYYYDAEGQRQEIDDASKASKMEAAAESLAALTTHLYDDDRFGVVLYNSEAHVAKPLSRVQETNMETIRGHIRDIRAGGGTNMSAGLETAIDLLESHEGADPTAVENRLVFMTDMMPNAGSTGRNSLSGLVQNAADRGLYTTFVGMGIDENADLAASLSEIRGANHYFIHSATDFERRLDDEFEYMVTPLVFDLQLELDGGNEIKAIYGSPNADRATGRLMSVSTLFPSPTSEGESRGSVVLLELDREPTQELELVASWEEIDGTMEADRIDISFEEITPESFESTGIQKAVCLARYASTLREWVDEISSTSSDEWQPMTDHHQADSEQWEQTSRRIRVPEEYRTRFADLQEYITATATAVRDDRLEQEVELLEELQAHERPQPTHDLSKEAFGRLEDLFNCAPTTNGELANRWGVESGSAVHTYLTSELGGYYMRNENGRLCPTDKAQVVVQSQSSPARKD